MYIKEMDINVHLILRYPNIKSKKSSANFVRSVTHATVNC